MKEMKKGKYSRVKPSRARMTWHNVNEHFLSCLHWFYLFLFCFTSFCSMFATADFIIAAKNYWLQFNCCCNFKLRKKRSTMRYEKRKQTNKYETSCLCVICELLSVCTSSAPSKHILRSCCWETTFMFMKRREKKSERLLQRSTH